MRKSYRIKQEREFQEVINHRKSYANKNLIIYILEKPQQQHVRIGISCGKKIGNAVMRNRVKRQIRVAVNHFFDELPPNLDLVIIARPNIINLTTKEVIQNFKHVTHLAEIL